MKYSMKIYEDFYLNNLPGPHGLAFRQCLKYGDLDKTGRHDYFQWLFPLPTESGFNKKAPTLDEELKAFILSRTEIIEKITMAAEIYMSYLWVLRDCKKSWPNPTDHNNLRISRLLRCLNLLNQTSCADFIYLYLLSEHEKNKDLTINNMDHFRSAMFNKTFFVITEDYTNLLRFLKSVLPDHDLIKISEADASDFTKLCEPVLNTKGLSMAEAMDSNILLRGKQFNISSEDRIKLEEYFHTFRFWY